MPSFLPRRLSRRQTSSHRQAVETQSHSPPTGTIVASSASPYVSPTMPSGGFPLDRAVTGSSVDPSAGVPVRSGTVSSPSLPYVLPSMSSPVSSSSTAKGSGAAATGSKHKRQGSGGSSIGTNVSGSGSAGGSRLGNGEAADQTSRTQRQGPASKSASSLTITPASTKSSGTVHIGTSEGASASPSLGKASSSSPSPSSTRSRIAKLTKRTSESFFSSPSGSNSGKAGQGTSSGSPVTASSSSQKAVGAGSARSPVSSPTTSRIPRPASPATPVNKVFSKPSPVVGNEPGAPTFLNRTLTSPSVAREPAREGSGAAPRDGTRSGSPQAQGGLQGSRLAKATTSGSPISPVPRHSPQASTKNALGSSASTLSPPVTPTITRTRLSFGPVTSPHRSPIDSDSTRNSIRSSQSRSGFNPAPPLAAGRLSPAMTSRENVVGFSDLPPTPEEEKEQEVAGLGEGSGSGPDKGKESGVGLGLGGAQAELRGLGIDAKLAIPSSSARSPSRSGIPPPRVGKTAVKHDVTEDFERDPESTNALASALRLPGMRAERSSAGVSRASSPGGPLKGKATTTGDETASPPYGQRVSSGTWLSGMSNQGIEKRPQEQDDVGPSTRGRSRSAERTDGAKHGSPLVSSHASSEHDGSSSHRSDRFPSMISTPSKPSKAPPSASLVTVTARDVVPPSSPLAPSLGAFDSPSMSKRFSKIPVPLSPTTPMQVGTSSVAIEELPVTTPSPAPAFLGQDPYPSMEVAPSSPTSPSRRRAESRSSTQASPSTSTEPNVARDDVARALSPGGEDVPLEKEQDPRSIVSADVVASPKVRPGIEKLLDTAPDATASMPPSRPRPPISESHTAERITASKPSYLKSSSLFDSHISRTSPGPPVAGHSPFWASEEEKGDGTESRKASLNVEYPAGKGVDLHEVKEAPDEAMTPEIARSPSPPLTPPHTTRRGGLAGRQGSDSPTPLAKSPRSPFPFTGLFADPTEGEIDVADGKHQPVPETISELRRSKDSEAPTVPIRELSSGSGPGQKHSSITSGDSEEVTVESDTTPVISDGRVNRIHSTTVYTNPFCLPNISVADLAATSAPPQTRGLAGLLRPRMTVDLTWKGALLPSEIAINAERAENSQAVENKRKRSSLMIPLDVGVAAARIPLNVGRTVVRAPLDLSTAAASYAYSLVSGWKVAS